LFLSLIFSTNRIVHVNSTYYDGTPKEIIIYEYSSLFTDNPLKIIDKLQFDRNGKLLFNFDNYFNATWKIYIGGEYSHTVSIHNNEFRFLKPSENCLDCYLPSTWDVSYENSSINVLAPIDLSTYSHHINNMVYSIKIITSTEFILSGAVYGDITFIKSI